MFASKKKCNAPQSILTGCYLRMMSLHGSEPQVSEVALHGADRTAPRAME